jgi:thiamine pyrophosphate-dependent acetolactate synthase large subunit-like protein
MDQMTARQALKVMAEYRGKRVVITTMTAITEWNELSDSPLDLAYLPSAMGQGPGLGLGLALAKPEQGVIVVNGDGSMLMNLGSLVTLANHPADVYLVVLDNGLYEVTGGQPVAGAGRTDFAALARGAGFGRVYTFATRDSWHEGAAEALSGPGPVFIWLLTQGRMGQVTPRPKRAMREQLARLRQALGMACP